MTGGTLPANPRVRWAYSGWPYAEDTDRHPAAGQSFVCIGSMQHIVAQPAGGSKMGKEPEGSSFVAQVQEMASEEELGSDCRVQAGLAQLRKQWGVAEGVLLAQGRLDEAIQMYTQAYKWDDAIG